MPKMNGFDFCIKVFEVDINPRVCFMSSALINQEALREQYPSLSIGCFIGRPITIENLVKRVYKFNNDQCTDLVSKIIRRHSLNIGNTEHGKLYIVDDNYLEEKLKILLEMKGEIGLIVKMGLYSGLYVAKKGTLQCHV